MVYFCQPEGCVTGSRRGNGGGVGTAAVRDATSFVFTLTDKDSGKTRYGICLSFYRPVEKISSTAPSGLTSNRKARSSNFRRESWRKSMEKSSDSAFSSDHARNVVDSDREPDPQHYASFNAPRLGVIGPDSESEMGSCSPSPRASRKPKARNHSLTSLCILSHHPFLSTFRECLFILKKLIDACNDSSSPKRSKLTTR